MTSRITLFALFLFTFNSQLVNAQALDTVTIFGRIVDQDGAVLPGDEIKANTRIVTSDDQCGFRLIQLEPGIFVVRVSCAGFATQEFTQIRTTSGQSLQFDVTLLPAAVVAEAVVVTTAETPIVDTKRAV